MAEYTYKDALKGALPTDEDMFYIHGLEYCLSGYELYLSNKIGANSQIFHLVGYKDANNLFREVLGEGNFREAYGTSSPYAKTKENARKILIKLWETPKFKVGTILKIKPDLHSGDDYGVYCNEEMTAYAGKTVRVFRTSTYGQTRKGYHILYKIKNLDGVEYDWNWTEDMFCESPVESVEESEEKKCIPKILPIKELKLKSEHINAHISIQLPKHSKHLKITL